MTESIEATVWEAVMKSDKTIEKWKNNFISLLEFYVSAEILNNPIQREEMEHKFLSQLPSLLELLDEEVGEDEIFKSQIDGAETPYDAYIAGHSKTDGINQERHRLHTLIHEAQSSLK